MDILNSIPILTEEQVGESKPKIKVEHMTSIHKSFTKDNPVTYKVFLSMRPDIQGDEREIYIQIIQRLQDNETLQFTTQMKKMIDTRHSYLANPD